MKNKQVKKPSTKKAKSPSKDPFKELVDMMQKKTQYSDSMGKGQVKGNDVASMRDILDDKE